MRIRLTLSSWTDRALAVLKWPVGIVALILLPGSALAMASLVFRALTNPYPIGAFLVGFLLYLALWRNVFRYTRFALVATFEHELTHALFAWLTFHEVTGLRATAFRGGYVTFAGKGNWLIAISPYFFPTFSLVLLAVVAMLPSFLAGIGNFFIGVAFAYHITSTLRQTHPGQTDLQQVGAIFSLAFLPTANLLTMGVLLGFVNGGWRGSLEFAAAVWQKTLSFVW